MGIVHAEITMINTSDLTKVREGLIRKDEVRSKTVTAVVDSGAMSLCIPEQICQDLGLSIDGEKPIRVANGQRVICKLTEPVKVCWKDRFTSLPAVVIPGAEIILLGVIPLEDLDLMVNPVSRELVGAHGDSWESMAL